jgi:hypothetical protein
VDLVAPNPGRVLEVDKENDSIDGDGVLNPDPEPSEEDIEEEVVEEQEVIMMKRKKFQQLVVIHGTPTNRS